MNPPSLRSRLGPAFGLFAVLGGGILASLLAQAQETPGAANADETVRVRLVQLAVTAGDRRGNPVTDLTADEISVKEGGRKMRVAFLEPFRKEQRAGEVPDLRLYVGAPGATASTVRSAALEPRHLILFVDVEHDYRLLKQEAIEDVLRFLRDDLGPEYRASIVAYDGEFHVESGFTASRDELASAVMRAYDRPPRMGLDLQARMRGLIGQLDSCVVSSGTVTRRGDERCLRGVMLEYADEVRPQAEDYLDGLERLIRYAGALRGRVTVLALSHGVAVDPTAELMAAMQAVYGNTEQLGLLRLEVGTGEGARQRLDRLLRLALDERVTLSFIDRNPAPTGDTGARLGTAYQPGAQPMQTAFTAPQADLEEIAATTGGVFLSETDLFAGLRRAMGLERGTYLLGYYLDEDLPPERLHKVRIGSSRKGVRVRHQRGRYAHARTSDSAMGKLSLGVPLSLEEDGGEGQFLPFTIVADPRRLGYEVDDEEARANLTLHFRVETGQGRVLAETVHLFSHAYPRDLWQESQVEPIQISGWVELPPGEYRLSAYLRNLSSGDGGEIAARWTVH